MRRTFFTMLLPLFAATLCAADDTPYKPTDADKLWIQSRVNFLSTNFGLSPAQQTQLLDKHMALVPEQHAYQTGPSIRQTVRSIQLGLDYAVSNTTEDVRATVLERLNGQLYGIYSRAPMSYANVLDGLEPTLTKEQVDKGYANFKSKFANQLRGGKTELKRENIDILAGQAVDLPSLTPKKISVDIPPAAPPVNINSTPAQPGPIAQNPTPTNPPIQLPPTPPPPRPVAPPPPPRNYGAAPARDTWASQVDSVTGKYKFRADQLAQAKKVLDQANKLADGTKDDKALGEIYGVMNDRVVALASMEQRIAVDGEKSVMPQPVMPQPGMPVVPGQPIRINPQQPVQPGQPVPAPQPGAMSQTPPPQAQPPAGVKPATPPPANPATPPAAKPAEPTTKPM